jgi:glucose/arabinose dehydrogenase
MIAMRSSTTGLRSLFGFAVLTLGLGACGGGGSSTGPSDGPQQPPEDGGPPAPYCTPKAGTNLKLTQVAMGLARPVFAVSPPNDARVFVVQQGGEIKVLKDGAVLATPFLSINVNDTGDEQGLLGLTFHPKYAQNGKFYVHYVIPGGNRIRIAQYTATPSADTANRTEKVILETDHPYDNHNGGTVDFGPDGFLYIALGDGGGGDDSAGNGQNRASKLAKILRIDVDGGDPYAIPPGNPWAQSATDAKETFVWGLRNPYRFTIDRKNGDLWIGDVGQERIEELDVVRAGTNGQNFGWPVFEGKECFTADSGGNAGCNQPANYVMPVTQRMRGASASILAGPVYRGGCMTDMVGRVFFGDYATGEVRSFPATTSDIAYDATTDHTADLDPAPRKLESQFSSFGTDAFGEIYVSALRAGRLYRIEVE